MTEALPWLLANQICSFFIMILMGFAATRFGLIGTAETKGITRLLMYVITPCVILMAYQTDYSSDTAGSLVLAFLAAIAIHILFIAGAGVTGSIFKLTSVERCSIIYTNSGNLTVPLVMAVMDARAVMFTTAYLAVQTVLIWTHCFTMIDPNARNSWKKSLFNINNLAVVTGIALFFFEIRITGPLESAMRSAGSTIAPLAMFSIGIMLSTAKFSDILKARNFGVSLLRLLFFPLLTVLLLAVWPDKLMFGGSSDVFIAVLLAAAAPSAVLVSQMALISNQDYRSASGVNIITDLLCLITIPFITWCFIQIMG
jgi:hypothetical protein